ncbi:uncharacterized protein LOC143152757 isoform X2 [Ptiloglossa arizonensis]|uniref:uncharacterized protein LOC143152757 isoform X2 n=1 Tax=Ptiloglossa arizonensis TaxID=3350558 RepID=UPI003F9F42AD
MTLTAARTEVNNEIVSLRQYVRQARIRIVNKLVRETKRLRTNRGSEKQLEKNKNKADKFLREVFALKGIKDDEISKFGIANLDRLQEILQNSSTDDKSRAMTKRKRKHSAKRKTKDSVDKFQEDNSKYKAGQEQSVEMDAKYDKRSGKMSPRKQMEERSEKQLEGNIKDFTKMLEINDASNDRGSKCTSNVVSNEAAVKRFAELLQETNAEGATDKCEANNKQELFNKPVEIGKKIDDFFLNSYKVVSSFNVTTFSPNGYTNVFDNRFNTLRVRNERGKFRREKVNRENSMNAKIRKINNEDTFYDRNTMAHWKQKKIVTPAEKTSTAYKNVKIGNSLENENLHPSWIARRKQQEIMKQGFQGKKIRFDED